MKVSIFSAPDLIVTELINYLPANTSELIIHSSSSMQNSVLRYALTHAIPFCEIEASTFFTQSMKHNIETILQRLLAQSEHLIIFSTPFSCETKIAQAYCHVNNTPCTIFELTQKKQI